MRVAVFGAGGFLGAWTVRALLAAGHDVVAVVRPTTDLWRIDGLPALTVISRASADWPSIVDRGRFEIVMLLDWEGVASSTRNDEIQWSNLERHRLLVEAAAEAGVRRVVGLGSQAEYGARTNRSDEESPTNPETTYGEAKVAAMLQLRNQCELLGLAWVWARVFSVYGPMDNAGMLLASIAGSLGSNVDVALSSGQQRWSYLYASDAGAALATLATAAQAGGIVNVGHPIAPPLREIVVQFASNFDSGGRLLFAPAPADPSEIAHLEPATLRLLALGWTPEVSQAQGLSTTAHWLTGHGVTDPYFASLQLPRPAGAREQN
ncbi:NAD-dependent epimerase/dehydratase family protein [Lacisediminihabitans sp. FW035]